MKKAIIFLALMFVIIAHPVQGQDLFDPAKDDYNYLESLYKYLHSHPELSGQEKNTSIRVAEELKKAGFRVTENVGNYGVVGVFENGKGPTILVRADMDALPITEETGLPYASKVKGRYRIGNEEVEVGVFHGCGHDMHTTIMIGTARFLMRNKDKWSGTLIMIGQPAEENTTGARAMIKDGLFTRFPRPDNIIGLHAFPMPSGTVGYRAGYWFAGDTNMDITIRGIGGNSHRPQDCKDPVVIAANTILALQTIISREIDTNEQAVLGVSPVRGGISPWTIPEEVFMSIDIRTFKEDIRQKMISSVKRITENIARAAGVPQDLMPVIKETSYSPPLYNDPELTRKVVGTLQKTLDDKSVVEMPLIMGTEDFGVYGTTEPRIPISFFSVGSVNPKVFEETIKAGKMLPGLHNPKFAPEIEPTIKTGVKAMSAVVLDLFGKK